MSAGEEGILLAGLDGANPLAFLAALGTLRTLSRALPAERVAMSWIDAGTGWRPVVTFGAGGSEQQLIDLLDGQLRSVADCAAFAIGDNLNLPHQTFRSHALCATERATAAHEPDREDADFLAAFGCEACVNDDGTIEDTDLRTMSGGGHQHFLKFFRNLVAETSASHLRRALLLTWDYADDGRNLNLRWDPADDRRYAMRWDDPSGDPIKTMRGANRLAIEALPLLPTMPTAHGLATTCFQGSNARNTRFVWPVWTAAISLDVVRALLGSTAALEAAPPATRRHTGVVAMYSSQRINPTPKYRNFAPGRPL
jgi:hypothetical protein